MVTFNELPPEIILRIFHFYLETESQKFLTTVFNVCSIWKNICVNSLLFKKYDGTLPYHVMMYLNKKGCLKNTKEIVISEKDNLNEDDEKELFSNLTNVEMIDLSLVDKFSKNALSYIATSCPKLKKIIIGKLTQVPMRLPCNVLTPFLIARGCNLTTIQISHCQISSTAVFNCIAKSCPNLEELNITNISSPGSFPTKLLQIHCPKLKVLNLDHYIKVNENKHPSGFPNLEVFTYVDSRGYWITDKEFKSIVFNSPYLKFLNLTNCCIHPESLNLLPAHSLEYLYISRSKIIQERGLADVLEKWSHSLKQVDVSYSKNACINRAILNLVTTSATSQLEVLNLNFTKITASVVEKILQSCNGIKILNLEGCKSLERGMKRTYSGISEFKILRQKLRKFISDNSNENLCVTLD